MSGILYRVSSWMGAFGPSLTVLTVMGNIVNTGMDKIGYFLLMIWQPVSIGINNILKWIIDEDRPKGSKDVNQLERLIELGDHGRGMPSGHAQMVSSTLVLALCLNLPLWILILCTIQTITTIWQRYTYKKHTKMQLAFGFLAGSVYSLFFSKFLEKHIDGNSLKITQDTIS